MKIKTLSLLMSGGVVALACWLVHEQSATSQQERADERKPGQADEALDKYALTADKGLGFLVKHQHNDGHWEGDGGKHPVAMTGLGGLALLMERDRPAEKHKFRKETTPHKAKYSANVRKAVDWLLDQSQVKRDGLIFSEHSSETARYMQGHGLATLFLAGVYEAEADDARRTKLGNVLIRAVKYIVKAQSTQGGWYDTSKVEGHDFASISATVIQIQALQAADNAGIPVPDEAIIDAQEYLRKALAKHKGVKPASRSADIAAALPCLGSTRRYKVDEEPNMKWFKICQAEIPVGRDIKFGRDELTHFYYAQALFIRGGDDERTRSRDAAALWSDYRTATFDYLQSTQNKDGSWWAGDGISVGPVYSTALWCTILQLDRNRHPSMDRRNEIVK
jgi:Prenyltransferase and squalene oxidase repeat